MPEPHVEEPLISAEGVTLRIGRHELLHEVDLRVAPGEIVTLIGPNGAGKTTLLRVLLGMLHPQAGRVWRRPGITIGYVPQRLQADIVLPLTAGRFVGLGAGRAQVRILPALREVGADHLLDTPLHELSGGEFQRVVLARALARAPDLLLLDEPAQGVDFAGQLELYRLIERLRERHGCGVLLVSHDLHLVMAATDHVVCLNRHVCCSGRPEAVSRHAEYLALFGPRAAQALALYTHAHDHHHDLAGAVVSVQQDAEKRAEPDQPDAG